MTSQLYFIVHGNPVAKQRHGDREYGGKFTPTKTSVFEKKVGILAKKAMLEQKFKRVENDPVSIDITFWLPRPKYHFISSGQIKTKYIGIQHLKVPDLDNLIKSVKDGMNKIAYRDDCLVMEITACKHFANNDPCTGITIYSGAGT